jgi:hypothetical protein
LSYYKLHNLIIVRALTRKKPDCYCELHHIKPKSMGGDNSKSNLVFLTAREHFIIHWLLKKIYNNRKMINAFFCMTKPVGNGRIRYTSHSFKYARESYIKWFLENKTGKNHPLYGVTGEDHPHFGMKRSDLTKLRIAEKAKERFSNGGTTGKERKVKNLSTGEIFLSINSAQRFAKSGNVSYAVNHGGTAGGCKYAYVDDNNNEIIIKSKLKGYASGSRIHNSVKIKRIDTGHTFDTAKLAGKSINVTGAAVLIAINQNRSCKGVYFERV